MPTNPMQGLYNVKMPSVSMPQVEMPRTDTPLSWTPQSTTPMANMGLPRTERPPMDPYGDPAGIGSNLNLSLDALRNLYRGR